MGRVKKDYQKPSSSSKSLEEPNVKSKIHSKDPYVFRVLEKSKYYSEEIGRSEEEISHCERDVAFNHLLSISPFELSDISGGDSIIKDARYDPGTNRIIFYLTYISDDYSYRLDEWCRQEEIVPEQFRLADWKQFAKQMGGFVKGFNEDELPKLAITELPG